MITPIVNKWLNNTLNSLIPPICAVCGAPGQRKLDICPPCLADLTPHYIACERCALPLQSNTSPRFCGHCLKDPPPYDSSYAFTLYQPPLDRLVQQLKFNNKLSYARLLGQLMATTLLHTKRKRPGAIIPVPLHGKRLRQRGFNQALEIARPIASQLNIPLETRLCRRIKATTEQSSLSAQQRAKNIKGAFAMTGVIEADHVAIIDDVMTTGSTVSELTRLLKQSGINKVEVWVCARAPT